MQVTNTVCTRVPAIALAVVSKNDGMSGARGPILVWVLLFAAVPHGLGSPLATRSGWVYVPGAQDLIQAGQWGCTSSVTTGPSSLSISATGSGYNTVIDTLGPLLRVQGDFSVLATLSSSSTSGTFLTLVGALNTGSDWWNGLKRLDVGVGQATIQVNYWTGGSSSASGQVFTLPPGAADPVNLEVARIADQIVVLVNGSQVGSFADPGLFASGQVYFGFNVAPQNDLKVLALAAAMPAGSSATLFASYLQVAKRTGSALRDLAEPAGFLVGGAVDPAHFADAGYAQAVGREFNLIVPENAMKFAATEPRAHQFNFCAADQIVAYAQANGMKVRGHNLVWQAALPSWLTDGNYSSEDAAAILQEHINTVMAHYKGQLIDWDVVNEAIAYTAPYGPQPSYWLTQLGPNYVDMAFQWAHAADPDAKLFYNDTGGEGLGAKSDAVYNLVKGMVSRGVPIDGVGLQMHLNLNSAPSQADISTNFARLGALGLEVHITEMDVRIPVDANGKASDADLAAQAAIYQYVTAACRANSNCTAMLTWGVSDAYSWIPGSYKGFGAALLLDAQYQIKPDYASVAGVLRSAADTASPVIYSNGIVIHGGKVAVVSPGSLVDIYGANLATEAATTAGLPLPATLGGVNVTVNGTGAPLYYVSSGLIVFQMPYSVAPGPVLVQVTANGVPGGSAAITVQPAAPSILTYGNDRAVVQNQDSTINSPANCALPGSYLTAYLIGSGPLTQPIATGAAALTAPLSYETLTATATLGNAPAPVTFAGMTPGLIGLMQVNLQVPKVSGDLPLQIKLGGFSSNQALVCVGTLP
jgi:endo-1,4-beta-xylanase